MLWFSHFSSYKSTICACMLSACIGWGLCKSWAILRQCEQRGPREEKSRRQWLRRWRPAAPGTTLYMHSTTLYFTKTHAPRAVRPYHHHHQTRHTRRLLILTGMRLCEAFPRELRYGQRLCRSQCAPAADRPHRAVRCPPSEPSHFVLYACAARPRPRRLEIRSLPPCGPG